MPSKNQGRLAQDMKREVIGVIGQMKDPRLAGGLLTVTRLSVTQDLDLAKVYISVLGGDAAGAVAALNRAAGHVRSEISRRMHIRKAPPLRLLRGRRRGLRGPYQPDACRAAAGPKRGCSAGCTRAPGGGRHPQPLNPKGGPAAIARRA